MCFFPTSHSLTWGFPTIPSIPSNIWVSEECEIYHDISIHHFPITSPIYYHYYTHHFKERKLKVWKVWNHDFSRSARLQWSTSPRSWAKTMPPWARQCGAVWLVPSVWLPRGKLQLYYVILYTHSFEGIAVWLPIFRHIQFGLSTDEDTK